MTAVTALFMLPAALVFPSLLRKANTPPPSATLAWRRRRQREIASGRHSQGMSDADYLKMKYDEAAREKYEDFLAALKAGERLVLPLTCPHPQNGASYDRHDFSHPPPPSSRLAVFQGQPTPRLLPRETIASWVSGL